MDTQTTSHESTHVFDVSLIMKRDDEDPSSSTNIAIAISQPVSIRDESETINLMTELDHSPAFRALIRECLDHEQDLQEGLLLLAASCFRAGRMEKVAKNLARQIH